ncbi:MAG: hypothetical protein J4F34_06160 [Gemmatimonadetes bacterium]|nr:hypothetical protein [Gemmatimonadota bacterium]
MQRSSARRGTVRFAIAALSLPIAVAAGCGDDPPEPITEAEAVALLEALGSVGQLVLDPANPSSTTDCPGGGTLTYAGTVVGDPLSGMFTFNAKMTASMCQFTSRGFSFEIEAGSVDQAGAMTVMGTSAELDLELDGNLDWSLPEKEGMCAVNVDLDGSVTLSNGELTGPVTGMMCGHSIELDASEFN